WSPGRAAGSTSAPGRGASTPSAPPSSAGAAPPSPSAVHPPRAPRARAWRGAASRHVRCRSARPGVSSTARVLARSTGGMPTPLEEAARRRTFAIISHPDAGKTTLTEKFLLYGGAVQSAGAVKARGERRRVTSDWMELEQKRGISITSTVLQFPYRNSVLNLLDTPGHRDFSEDTYRVLAAADAAIMVLDAAKGIEPQTLKLFEVVRERNLPLLTFVNKWDRPGLDGLELLDLIERQLSIVPTPVTWPVGIAGDFRGVVDRRTGEYIRFTRTARGASEAGEEVLTPEQAAEIEGAAWEAATDDLSLLDEVGAH